MSIDEELPALDPLDQVGGDSLEDLDPLPSAAPPTDNAAPPQISLAGLTKTYHHFPSIGAPGGLNLLQQIERGHGATDKDANARRENVYHPFCSKEDWELARWLADSGMPQTQINAFLKLQRVSTLILIKSLYANSTGRLKRILLHSPPLGCYANVSRAFPHPLNGSTL